MPVRYILSSVWVRLSIFSVIHYVRGGVFSVYPSLLWRMREYINLSCYQYQIGSTEYYPLFKFRSWKVVCTVCLSILLWHRVGDRPLPAQWVNYTTTVHHQNESISYLEIFFRNLQLRYFEFAFTNLNHCSHDTSHKVRLHTIRIHSLRHNALIRARVCHRVKHGEHGSNFISIIDKTYLHLINPYTVLNLDYLVESFEPSCFGNQTIRIFIGFGHDDM